MPRLRREIDMQTLSPQEIEHVAGGAVPVELPGGPLPYNPFPDILIK